MKFHGMLREITYRGDFKVKAYAVKFVEKPDEIIDLIANGWEFVCEAKGRFIFRKKL